MNDYVELQIASNFSFLRGASHPDELVLTAAALGYDTIALADRNSFAGIVRAHLAARQAGLRLVVATRLTPRDGPEILCFPTDRAAYGRLCRLLTLGKRRAAKGDCDITLDDVADHAQGQIAIVLPPPDLAPGGDDGEFARHLTRLREIFGHDCHLAAQHLYRGDDDARIARLAELAHHCDTPLVATNDVHMHSPARRRLADVLTCIREHVTIDQAGFRLAANAERRLKSPQEMARLFARYPDAVARTRAIAERCRFDLESLRYEYPVDPVPDGCTPQEELTRLSWEGAARRYPDGVPDKVARQIEYELALIEQLGYAPYFLTVHDIVRFARSRGILCQGRGSAANSAVCFALGITAVDPSRLDLLFERFVSAERGEPPDIDVDFEHERREEVIQYIYDKYGRERAGIAATLITYRSKSAVREVGKALGLSEDVTGRLAETVWGRSREGVPDDRVREAGLDPDEPRLRLTLELAAELIGFPRHLSQHVGGFVITAGPLSEMVPVGNAAMADRTFIEWDKDDIDALGILKIDVLALGMLTCLRKGLDLIARHHGRELSLATVPAEDPSVYDMLCRADAVGVFQVESRAQLNMLPRLKPRSFYDLVIEVAIVRPGPIQGDMVHPYLRRRAGLEDVDYPSDALANVLAKTLGVPLFQEQAMRIAVVAAGFTPSQADQLRRAMATFRRTGAIHHFEAKLIDGMVERGYDRDFAERCFKQIEGFGEYGFPESHAASFALLVYVSAWMKCHYPAAFACALLNSQPMGFYAPAQIVGDARDHGIEVRPVDVNHSDWDCTLEPGGPGATSPALRLGFRQMKGLRADEIERLVARRGDGYRDPVELWRESGIHPATLERLARADAFGSLNLSRREALWAVKRLKAQPLPLFAAAEAREQGHEPAATLPRPAEVEEVVDDYAALRLTLKTHPLALMREGLTAEGLVTADALRRLKPGARVELCGLVTTRQRPGTANGIIFVTLEDETGPANLIVRPPIVERFRRAVFTASIMRARGRIEREGEVIHLLADSITDEAARLRRLLPATPRLPFPSRDFH